MHVEDADYSQCVLMFSGGRDSSLAALMLAKAGITPTLVTITSDHLRGIESVRQRIGELTPFLSSNTRWLQIEQPIDLRTDTSFYAQTCLPCHHAYVVAAACVAGRLGAKALAMGYTEYQSDWPEQTPLAVASLKNVLADHHIKLLLPVHNLSSRDEASIELEANGLSGASLEQKCSRQVTNVKLEEAHLRLQIALWDSAIRASFAKIDSIKVTVTEDRLIGAVG